MLISNHANRYSFWARVAGSNRSFRAADVPDGGMSDLHHTLHAEASEEVQWLQDRAVLLERVSEVRMAKAQSVLPARVGQ